MTAVCTIVQSIFFFLSLIGNFGSSKIDDVLIKRMEKISGKKAHHFLRRGRYLKICPIDVLKSFDF